MNVVHSERFCLILIFARFSIFYVINEFMKCNLSSEYAYKFNDYNRHVVIYRDRLKAVINDGPCM